ncbi:MAG: octanoyltransferase [Betaproteobacteria bacterium RIFCSPLOWO2_02_FULL_67_26]|nr:MAG: octanoyltransferase [Betaproteobacteria bacterium RIFCSPLOWO2_02_FULL_67_26]
MTAASIATGVAAGHGPVSDVAVRRLGRTLYEPAWRAMQEFTARRGAGGADELWLTEHPPVYTLGVAGRSEHLPRAANGIPVIKTDRGGQITYHGPGQIVVYLLLDLRRNGLTVRSLVRTMEMAVIDLLAAYGIAGEGRADAPGVYVDGAKIAALGLRIRNGCSYHGLALNADMDLSPFHAIDPCGYSGLAVTQARDLGVVDGVQAVGEKLVGHLLDRLP